MALKLVRDTGRDAQSRERLWREARAAASVSHPNVCQVFEVGKANGELFLAMELLEGEALSVRLARGALPLGEGLEITLAVLAALEAIHAKGIVSACRYCGLLDASRRADAEVRRLDPSMTTSGIHTHWMLGDYHAVLTSGVQAPLVVALSMLALGRTDTVMTWLADQETRVPPTMRRLIGALRLLLDGRREEAVVAILAIASSNFRDPEGLYYLARQLAYADAGDEAIALLDRGSAAGFSCYPVFAADAWLDPIRHRPAFAAILDRMRQAHELALAAFAASDGERVLGGM